MARTKGSLKLSSNMEINAGAPIDARTIVPLRTDLTAVNTFPYSYVGMLVSVQEEGMVYILVGADPTDETNWVQLGVHSDPNVIQGYYNALNHLFYEDDQFTTLIPSRLSTIYIDLAYNKCYRYDGDEDIFIRLDQDYTRPVQVYIMPGTGAEEEGFVYQYIGETDQNYTNGYFYKCIEDPTDPGEYIWQNIQVQEGGGSASLPAGGTTGQALVKKTNADDDVEWATINSLPAGGTQGQQLVKNSSTDGDASWTTVYKIPTGGTANQALVKNSSTGGDTKWKTITEAHVIKNSAGTSMTQRANLKFDGLNVTDDSINGITKVAGEGLNSDSLDDIANASLPSTLIAGSGLNYTTSEQIVGRWIDGKPIYQKTISIGNYPNNTSKSIAHGITSLDKILSLEVYASDGTVNVCFSSSYTNSGASQNIIVYRSGDNIKVSTNFDASSFLGHITLQYTKTTD